MFQNAFKNVGSKIKGLATLFFAIGVLAALAAAVYLITVAIDSEDVLWCLAAIGAAIVGSIISWLGTVILYAFGELVESVVMIADVVVPERDDYVTPVEPPLEFIKRHHSIKSAFVQETVDEQVYAEEQEKTAEVCEECGKEDVPLHRCFIDLHTGAKLLCVDCKEKKGL